MGTRPSDTNSPLPSLRTPFPPLSPSPSSPPSSLVKCSTPRELMGGPWVFSSPTGPSSSSLTSEGVLLYSLHQWVWSVPTSGTSCMPRGKMVYESIGKYFIPGRLPLPSPLLCQGRHARVPFCGSSPRRVHPHLHTILPFSSAILLFLPLTPLVGGCLPRRTS